MLTFRKYCNNQDEEDDDVSEENLLMDIAKEKFQVVVGVHEQLQMVEHHFWAQETSTD